MKLFGNSSGKHVRTGEPLPPSETLRRASAPQQEFTPPPSQNPPARSAAAVPEHPSPPPVKSRPSAPKKKKSHFLLGYLVFVVVFLALIAGGLTVLWQRMDAYERSRPYRPMDQLMGATSASDWREKLSDAGVEDSFLDTLDFSDVSYTKKLGVYSDDRPVYSIRFGKKSMLTATLAQGDELRFGYHAWEIKDMTLVDSGLTVFAPEGATVTVRGQAVGPECLVQRNAQSVSPGMFEAGRTDIPGLTKYVLNRCFTAEDVAVTDADGNALAVGYQKGNAYYYPPLTSGYVIEAPSLLTVTVNGIVLTEENSEITNKPLEDFEGLDGSVPVSPADVRYVIDGLLARPVVSAVFSDGTELSPLEEADDRWIYRLLPDEEFAASQKDYILKVFDAYIAFLGNRNADLNGNYRRYLAYLVPGSEAADRAAKSLDSLYWVKGRDVSLDGVTVGDVIRYGDDCYTAWLDFTRRIDADTEDNNSYLFIFVRYNDQWRVVRVMNKTSFIRES